VIEINSNDYHDFVIKNGKLIGEFEQMYQKSKDIPWHQDKQENWLDVRLTIELLKDLAPFDSLWDFGAGLGYFLEILRKYLGNSKCKIIGFDISKTACVKAKKLFPQNSNFFVIDLTSDAIPQELVFLKKERKKIVRLARNIMVYFS